MFHCKKNVTQGTLAASKELLFSILNFFSAFKVNVLLLFRIIQRFSVSKKVKLTDYRILPCISRVFKPRNMFLRIGVILYMKSKTWTKDRNTSSNSATLRSIFPKNVRMTSFLQNITLKCC